MLKRAIPILTACATLHACIHPASSAQDAPSDPDGQARAILAKAAERQNARGLADPGSLESFHVVFHKATFEREKAKEGGATVKTEVETDTNGLVIDWKAGSIRTELTLDGRTTTKAWWDPNKAGWIFDGTTVSSLTGPERRADHDQLQFHRTVVSQMLDFAILEKMLRGKERWRVLSDSEPYKGTVALERLADPATPGSAPLYLWIENPEKDRYGDVIAASIAPTAPNGYGTHYRFRYHDAFPTVRVKGTDGKPEAAKMRFPFGIDVYEKRDGFHKVLALTTGSVDINTVSDDAFKRPKPR